MKAITLKPFDASLEGELLITKQTTVAYEVDDDTFDDDDAVPKLRKQAEKNLEPTASAAITEFWEAIWELIANGDNDIEVYNLSNLKGNLRYHLIQTPYGDAGVWDAKNTALVAGCTQHSPDNPDDRSLLPAAIQRAMVLSDGSKEVCFFKLKQDYAKHGKSFLALKEKFEAYIKSKQNQQELQQGFLTLSETEKSDFLNLIAQAISSNSLSVNDHPLFIA